MTLHEKAKLAEQRFLEALFEEYGEVETMRYAPYHKYSPRILEGAIKFEEAAREWVREKLGISVTWISNTFRFYFYL